MSRKWLVGLFAYVMTGTTIFLLAAVRCQEEGTVLSPFALLVGWIACVLFWPAILAAEVIRTLLH